MDICEVEKPHSWHKNFFSGAWITEWAVRACFHLNPRKLPKKWGVRESTYARRRVQSISFNQSWQISPSRHKYIQYIYGGFAYSKCVNETFS